MLLFRRLPQTLELTPEVTSFLQARARKTGLRVTAISPGMVETEFYQVTQFNDRDRVKAGSPYEDFQCLKAEDIAQAVVYALSAPDHMDVNDILIRPTQQLT